MHTTAQIPMGRGRLERAALPRAIASGPRAERLIVIEGTDGTGKTTTARAVAQRLGAGYYKTPGTVSAERRAEVDRTASPLSRCRFYLDAVESDSRQLEAELGRPQWVVVDRYILSTFIYHVALDPRAAALFPVEGILIPARCFVLTASPRNAASELCGARSFVRVRSEEGGLLAVQASPLSLVPVSWERNPGVSSGSTRRARANQNVAARVAVASPRN